jgi:hypothetical protein
MLHKTKLLFSVAALGGALTLLVAAPSTAMAAQSASKSHNTTKHNSKKGSNGSKGSNAGGSFCQLYKSELNDSTGNETQITKDMESNDWAPVQKILEKDYGSVGKIESEMTADLASAPANVQAAVRTTVKTVVPEEIAAVKNSTSVATYETASEKIFQTPAGKNSATVLGEYEQSQCGSVTPTT